MPGEATSFIGHFSFYIFCRNQLYKLRSCDTITITEFSKELRKYEWNDHQGGCRKVGHYSSPDFSFCAPKGEYPVQPALVMPG